MNPLLGRLAGYLQEKANAQREEALRSEKPVYDFGIGDPREPTPEFIRKALRDALPEVSQYPSIAGIPPLRKAVSAYLKRRFALSLQHKWITVEKVSQPLLQKLLDGAYLRVVAEHLVTGSKGETAT